MANVESTFLLQGVTGSGKTEVYMHIIEDLNFMLEDMIEPIVKKGDISPTELDNIYKAVKTIYVGVPGDFTQVIVDKLSTSQGIGTKLCK